MPSDPANNNQTTDITQQSDDYQNSNSNAAAKNNVFFDQLQNELNQLNKQKIQQENKRLQDLKPKHVPADNNKPKISQDDALNDLLAKLNAKAKTKTQNSVKNGLKKKEVETPRSSGSPESVPIREVSVDFEPNNEVGEFMEPVPDPQEFTLPTPVEDEFGEILLESTQIAKPNIILPIDDQEIEKALHQKVVDSIRWLAEWTKRVILMYPKRVFFKKTIEN